MGIYSYLKSNSSFVKDLIKDKQQFFIDNGTDVKKFSFSNLRSFLGDIKNIFLVIISSRNVVFFNCFLLLHTIVLFLFMYKVYQWAPETFKLLLIEKNHDLFEAALKNHPLQTVIVFTPYILLVLSSYYLSIFAKGFYIHSYFSNLLGKKTSFKEAFQYVDAVNTNLIIIAVLEFSSQSDKNDGIVTTLLKSIFRQILSLSMPAIMLDYGIKESLTKAFDLYVNGFLKNISAFYALGFVILTFLVLSVLMSTGIIVFFQYEFKALFHHHPTLFIAIIIITFSLPLMILMPFIISPLKTALSLKLYTDYFGKKDIKLEISNKHHSKIPTVCFFSFFTLMCICVALGKPLGIDKAVHNALDFHLTPKESTKLKTSAQQNHNELSAH